MDKYNVTRIHYRDLYGKLLWKSDMVFKKLYGIGDIFIDNYIAYEVIRIAVVNNIQHVNIEKIGIPMKGIIKGKYEIDI